MAIATSQRAVDGGRIKGPAACPAVVEVVMRFTLPNQKTAHVGCHGHYTTPPANMQSLADALYVSLKGAWSTNLGGLMATTTLFTGLSARDMTAITNPAFEAAGASVAGTGPGIPMPPDVSGVLTENVTTRGRGAKGRMYIPGWSVDADAAGGQMTDATKTSLDAFGTALFNALTTQTLTPCVAKVARQAYIGLDGTNHPARTATFAPVTSYVCKDLEWDTQRRRGR